MGEIARLLKEVYEITAKYDEKAKFSMESFSIFHELGLDFEEKYHSKIIALLLDPNGGHKQGNVFLNLFLNIVGIKDFDTENAIVEVEKFIGHIDEDYENGGRIDIVITDINNHHKQIFIENKLRADDQEKQLSRYSSYNKNAELIYLTPDGKEATEKSLGNLPEDSYKTISYGKDILQWLEECEKAMVCLPVLQETIKQYAYLLKLITGQTRSKDMDNKIIEVLTKDANNISAAFDIADNLAASKIHIIDTLIKPALEKLAQKYELLFEFEVDKSTINKNYIQIWFWKDEWELVYLCFEFQKPDLNQLLYGTYKKWMADGAKPKRSPKGIEEFIASYPEFHKNDCWFLWKDMEKYINWDKTVFSEVVHNPDSNGLYSIIEIKIQEMLEIINEYEKTGKKV